MDTSEWFDDVPVLGRMSPAQAAAKLHEIGEDETANALLSREVRAKGLMMGAEEGPWEMVKGLFRPRAWQHTAHAFGYLAPAPAGDEMLPIKNAGNIEPDSSLKNARVKITLDRLRVADYPGGGMHQVLFDFYAQNQAQDKVEHLHFNATYRVREGEHAATVGYPIFVGLNVGSEGLAFKCFTVNVRNDDDEALLSFLDSDVFKAGLKLATTAQPALAPFSEMALGLTKAIATRNRNVPVQDFYMGLDFSNIPTRARLAEGAYLAVQIPEQEQAIWDWSEWVYNPNTGRVVNRDDPKQLIPYNYLVFSVTRYQE